MTTMTSTVRMPRHQHVSADDGARHSRRPGARAFALGATIALLCAAIAWVAVAGLRDGSAQRSATETPAAAAQPATSGGAAGSTASGSAAGSTTAAAAGAQTGTSSQSVATLQRDLGQLNYYESPVDGVSGPATVAAIKDFQRANGLPVDGVAGPNTMAKINQQMATGDNQMGPSGPPAKPANTTPAKPANTTPANGQSGTSNGGAAMGVSSGGA